MMNFGSLVAKKNKGVLFNNISELRLFFALCVVVSHSIQLGNFNHNIFMQLISSSSEISVQGFFILSGFLVYGSYSRLLNYRFFFIRRFLRIYPGYLMAVIVFLALAVAQAYTYGESIKPSDVIRYLIFNLLFLNFLQPGIEGIFQAGTYQEINGALWTIKLEVMFYAVVPILYLAGLRWTHRGIAILLILIGLSWRPALESLVAMGFYVHPSFAHQLPGQLHFFGLGLLMFDLSDKPNHKSGNMVIFLVAVLLTCYVSEVSEALQIAILSIFIYSVTQLNQLRTALNDIDLSYGIYLSHFPIIQLLICYGKGGIGAEFFLPVVLLLSISYAIFSWFCVERPSLNLSRKV